MLLRKAGLSESLVDEYGWAVKEEKQEKGDESALDESEEQMITYFGKDGIM